MMNCIGHGKSFSSGNKKDALHKCDKIMNSKTIYWKKEKLDNMVDFVALYNAIAEKPLEIVTFEVFEKEVHGLDSIVLCNKMSKRINYMKRLAAKKKIEIETLLKTTLEPPLRKTLEFQSPVIVHQQTRYVTPTQHMTLNETLSEMQDGRRHVTTPDEKIVARSRSLSSPELHVQERKQKKRCNSSPSKLGNITATSIMKKIKGIDMKKIL